MFPALFLIKKYGIDMILYMVSIHYAPKKVGDLCKWYLMLYFCYLKI